jgi:hypothetical protein
MSINPRIAAFAVVLALAACDSKSPTTAAAPEANTAEVAAPAAKIVLPPAMKSSKQYRCKDDSIVTVGLLEGDMQANVSADGGAPTLLKAPVAGAPLVAEGYELTVAGDTLTLTRPGHPKQACKG